MGFLVQGEKALNFSILSYNVQGTQAGQLRENMTLSYAIIKLIPYRTVKVTVK